MTVKRRCWKCSEVAEADGMRYDISGRDLICPECLRAEQRGKGMETATAKVTNTNKIQPNNIKDNTTNDDEGSTISYQCGSCGLGFSEKKGARVRCCPYCGKGNFRIAFRDSAQKIIEESEGKEFES